MEVVLDTDIHILFNDWLDSNRHSLFTQSLALIEPKLGAEFYTCNGYFSGKIVALIKNERIVHLWRTTEFAIHDEDSFLELSFEKYRDKSKIIFMHLNIPPEVGLIYIKKWYELYMYPMQQYYSNKK
ncbi:MAG: hypothetical protein COW44_03825 [Flavobacteriaceae bacterium CG17_big_fil_post_rev_8_21_14_2_50_33_15]|nr:MAG: hypothetical protein COW44_03825 [Flavobacteriaceae bacterium CG17_big_fil_post_rev_8_21_14_2_50_33_15]PJB19306.1 MAG: hypothetical protein CO117_05170 [Flavobacteriaceae bacterium CG_4_9_14_3_um_filter_33_16]